MKYALNGVQLAANGYNLRIMIITGMSVIIMAALLKINNYEWCIIILCIMTTLSAEIMNSAIESMCDFIQPSYNKEIGIVKDLAAGSVLILSIGSTIIGLIILGPRILDLFSF